MTVERLPPGLEAGGPFGRGVPGRGLRFRPLEAFLYRRPRGAARLPVGPCEDAGELPGVDRPAPALPRRGPLEGFHEGSGDPLRDPVVVRLEERPPRRDVAGLPRLDPLPPSFEEVRGELEGVRLVQSAAVALHGDGGHRNLEAFGEVRLEVPGVVAAIRLEEIHANGARGGVLVIQRPRETEDAGELVRLVQLPPLRLHPFPEERLPPVNEAGDFPANLLRLDRQELAEEPIDVNPAA